MQEGIDLSKLTSSETEIAINANREIMIRADEVSMVFNRASEQLSSFKEYAIKLAKRELFFEGLHALNKVSFEVEKGDVFGIIGTNGSGKSTLLKVIAGVLDPTEGTCSVNGSIAPLIELGAGFDQELTARENIFLNGALLGYSKNFIQENFNDIVAFAEVADFLDMPLKNYSSGMVARIAFSIATVIVPDILLVDEVLSVGDFMFQKKCEDRISTLIEKHDVTVLIVSHSNEQIARLCNKVLWIEKGNTRMFGDAAEVCRFYSAIGGRVGSSESESRILAMMSEDRDIPGKLLADISGDDYYATSVHAADVIWRENLFSTAVIACGTTHINTILANGLAGFYDAPILQTKTDQIPATVMHILEKHRPSKIFFFDSESNAEHLLKTLECLQWSPEILPFTAHRDLFNLSKQLYFYGQNQKIWGEAIAVIDFDDNPESLVAAPLLYGNRIPVFSSCKKDPLDAGELLSIATSHGVKKAYLFGKHANHGILPLFEKAGIEIIAFIDEESHRSCLRISSWIDNLQSTKSSAPKELCVASISLAHWQDVLMCGAYCAHQNSALLLQDPSNLDSIAACIDYITDNKERIESLTFFGGQSNLSATDRTLLCQALLS